MSRRVKLPFILLITCLLIPVFSACGNSPPAAITFAAIPSGSAALVYIAQEKGFFADNNLTVTVKDYPTGVATTDALMKGEVEIAWSAEIPIIRKVFAGEALSMIASISRFSDQFLFGRVDSGILSVTDLPGKTIGVPRGTIAEFYLGRFLQLNGVNIQEASIVDVPPAQSVAAIITGDVDALVTWEPFSNRIKTSMEGKVTIWPVQSSQPGYGLIVARNDWIAANQDVIERFLESLAAAEEFLIENVREGKEIVRLRVGYDEAFMDVFWAETQFFLSLDQSLILAMEDEARWLISSNLTAEKQVPDFLDFIAEDNLKAVKTRIVNIIR
jgi:NitT/TauT family transport system substrate-binding protein